MPNRSRRAALCRISAGFIVATLVIGTPLTAQPKAKRKPVVTAPFFIGTWTGTAVVALGDSTITVPVIYNFSQTAGAVGGTAIVPGQATGVISDLARDGSRVQFRVTPKEGKPLEHDGTLGADGALAGTVNMDNKPVAKFKITVRPPPAK